MPRNRGAGFSISVFGRFAYTLSVLYVHCSGWFYYRLVMEAMFVQLRQGVREQPDT